MPRYFFVVYLLALFVIAFSLLHRLKIEAIQVAMTEAGKNQYHPDVFFSFPNTDSSIGPKQIFTDHQSSLISDSSNFQKSTILGDQVDRCRSGVDTSNRSTYWKFNDDIFPGLHDAFAKWDELNMIFLVRDWRNRKQFTRRNKNWTCHFADCGSQSKGRFVIDSKGSGSTQIVQCDVPDLCLARWKAADPNLTQVQRVHVTASSAAGVPFRYSDVEFCIYPPARPAPVAGGNAPALQLVACTMIKASLGRNRELLLEWLAYHRLQGFERFLLYSNEDSAALRALLRPLLAEGAVDVMEWQWPAGGTNHWAHQIPQLNSCVRRFRGLAKCAPPRPAPPRPDDLTGLLPRI